MSLSTIAAGIAIDIVKDIAKDEIVKLGKKTVDFKDSGSGKKLGTIINYREGEKNNNLLLFVHGFSGSSSETFGVTPDILVADADFNGWDVFSIGYSSDIFPSIGKGLWSVNPDITKIAAYLNTLLNIQFNDKKYDRIAFVGHSMGGLAIQRAILDAEPAIQKKLSYVLFFGTPSAGLKASLFNFWNTQLHDLSSKSEFIKKLRKDWSDKYSNETPFVFKTIAGTKDEFVPVESSLSPFPKSCHGVIEGNHISMIKPIDINDLTQQSFTLILKTLTNQKNIKYLLGDPGEINILLGEYKTVIDNYKPKVAGLAKKPLIDLVFALECTGRQEEALQVLQNHPLAANNSDILGIIGGRYKRNYLLSGLQKDLDMSFQYYQNALAIAEDKKDHGQIYYHAINLAFLKIAGEDDKNKMKEYAQLALDNCDSENKDKWELATIAEANLYLGKMDVAEDYYKRAAEGANARDKSSIYSNAYYGYQAVTKDTAKDSTFIKMLEDTLL